MSLGLIRYFSVSKLSFYKLSLLSCHSHEAAKTRSVCRRNDGSTQRMVVGDIILVFELSVRRTVGFVRRVVVSVRRLVVFVRRIVNFVRRMVVSHLSSVSVDVRAVHLHRRWTDDLKNVKPK
jgi:hypothetical protein